MRISDWSSDVCSSDLAAAYLVVALLTPILTATADYRGNKRNFMMLFTFLGALACGGLFFFTSATLELGIICFAVAAIGYCGGVVFSNSYLPEIASRDQQDRTSAKGYAYRSEEHTPELQSLMRNSYADF